MYIYIIGKGRYIEIFAASSEITNIHPRIVSFQSARHSEYTDSADRGMPSKIKLKFNTNESNVLHNYKRAIFLIMFMPSLPPLFSLAV